MSTELPIVRIARIVVEAATPLSIGTGQADEHSDQPIVRDANGLPLLPGTSIAGVLRAMLSARRGDDARRLFGYAEGSDGAASRLHCSHGHVLDAEGRAVDGLVPVRRITGDSVLSLLADGSAIRDRVRLTERGAAALQGKFDRGLCPQGARFAFELALWSGEHEEPEDEADWQALLALIAGPELRIGGAVRAGLGRLKLVRGHARRLDLREAADAAAFAALPAELHAHDALGPVTPEGAARLQHGTLTLRLRGPWRIGQGLRALRSSDKTPDLLPLSEPRIVWRDGRAAIEQDLLRIPGSSIKGALAHRVAFHLRRLCGDFADRPDPQASREVEALHRALFGYIDGQDGRAGRLFIDDAALPVDGTRLMHLMHNALDRFAGGVQNRKLFAEEVVIDGELTLELALDAEGLDPRALAALQLAVEDLCAGRLPVGGRVSTGLGTAEGRLDGALAETLRQARMEASA